ncbi:MAG: A/G-specific adenine glycosylase, partial [Planctomycetales bacterium]|nr:A/G-specific adenine glycosylase [Planctomycetales bacterium]
MNNAHRSASPEDDDLLPDAVWRAALRKRLLAWYARNARDLPWRGSDDPYAVWISEIMLQQTQVETVKAYFTRFLAELPDVHALAAAPEEQVLRLWEGLGYYRRARQLHRAAQEIVALHDGRFPRDAAALVKLSGVGRYTAGAIASIAFDAREPIVEANTVRLYSRLLAYRDDPLKATGQRLLWTFAGQLLPTSGVGRFNQALMELGSLVCTPKSPRCAECPARSLCPAYAQNLQAEIPQPKAKTKYEDSLEAAIMIRRGKKFLLRRAPAGER